MNNEQINATQDDLQQHRKQFAAQFAEVQRRVEKSQAECTHHGNGTVPPLDCGSSIDVNGVDRHSHLALVHGNGNGEDYLFCQLRQCKIYRNDNPALFDAWAVRHDERLRGTTPHSVDLNDEERYPLGV